MNEMNQEVVDKTAESQNVEIDLVRIFASLLHYAWLIILLAVIGAGTMFFYTKYKVEPEYKSTSSLYIHDKNVTDSAGGSGLVNFNTAGEKIAEYLQNTYRRTLVSDTTLNIVISNLGLEYGAARLRGMISINVEDYPYFDITVTANDPYVSARIANELSSVLSSQVSKIVGGTKLTHVDKAAVPAGPSGPNLSQNVLLGFIIGLVIGCGIIVVIEITNNKINDDEYLINTYGISVLASITEFDVVNHRNQYQKYGRYKYYRKSAEDDDK